MRLACFAFLALAAAGSAYAADPSSAPVAPGSQSPVDVPGFISEPPFHTDEDGALADGFLIDQNTDHQFEKERDVIAEHFMKPLGESVGRKMPLEFSYTLMDLTGKGYNSLVLWPRVWELYPADRDGAHVYVYTFDGKAWKLSLDNQGYNLGVRPHFEHGKPTGAMDIALIMEHGYKSFVWDDAEAVWKFKEFVKEKP